MINFLTQFIIISNAYIIKPFPTIHTIPEMGKEAFKLVRKVCKLKPMSSQVNTKELQMEFAKRWASPKEVVFEHQIVENSHVTVYVRTVQKKFVVLCSGMSNKDNSYKNLFTQLQLNGVICPTAKVRTFQVLRENMWEVIDPSKDTFKANESIIIDLYDMYNTKKNIVKFKRPQ